MCYNMRLFITLTGFLFCTTLFGQASRGTIPYEKSSKYGLMTEDGKIIISAKYKSISKLNDTIFVATNLKNRKGVISSNGNIILPFRFEILYLKFTTNENSLDSIPVIVAGDNFRDFYYDLSGKQIKSRER